MTRTGKLVQRAHVGDSVATVNFARDEVEVVFEQNEARLSDSEGGRSGQSS